MPRAWHAFVHIGAFRNTAIAVQLVRRFLTPLRPPIASAELAVEAFRMSLGFRLPVSVGRFAVIADDGRGIDWERVATRATRAGLPATSSLDLERALFVDGISTAASVTDVSGRGVGMGALLSATEEHGGSLSIKSTLHEGTSMRFSFPVSAQRGPDLAQPSATAN